MRQHHDNAQSRRPLYRGDGTFDGRGRARQHDDLPRRRSAEYPFEDSPRPRGGRGRGPGRTPEGPGGPHSDPHGERHGGPRGGAWHEGPEAGPRGGRHGEGRGGGRGRRGGPGRRNRGDVRTAVLLLLAEEPMHGYQLMQTIGERTNGRWAPSPGAIYPTLSQLEDEGLVVVQKDGGRKLASLTETGTTLVSEQKGSWNSPFGDQDQEAEIPDLRVALHDLGGAIREVQRSGTAGQIGQVAELLAGTKRAVYGILASEQEPGASAEAADADGVDDTDPADTTDE